MRIRVLYFQNIRKVTGMNEETVEIENGATVGNLIDSLVKKSPALAAAVPSLLFAVNEVHARESDPLKEGDTVAVMPPFSGG